MQSFEILLFAFTALSTGVSAAAIPQSNGVSQDVTINPQYQMLKRNQSAAFAWQISGAALSSNEVDTTCQVLSDGKCDKWIEEGLDLANLQEPICKSASNPLNATELLPNVVDANSKAFSVALMNSFPTNDEATWSRLCRELRYRQLDEFMLDADSIVAAACNASSTPQSPRPFSGSDTENNTAVMAYNNAHSVLYAWEYASQATDTNQLNQYCAQAPEYHANWKALQLNPGLVQSTLCSFQKPICADEGKAAILEWTSKSFIVAMENVSNVPGWLEFLCNSFDVNSMNAVGLDGELVKGSVCQDAKAGKQ